MQSRNVALARLQYLGQEGRRSSPWQTEKGSGARRESSRRAVTAKGPPEEFPAVSDALV